MTIAKEHLGHLNHDEKNDIAETILSSTKKNMKNFYTCSILMFSLYAIITRLFVEYFVCPQRSYFFPK